MLTAADIRYVSQDGVRWASRQIVQRGIRPGLDQQLLIAMAQHANGQGELFPSQDRLAALTGADPRSVRRSITGYRERGLIERVMSGRAGRSSRYRLLNWHEAAVGWSPQDGGSPPKDAGWDAVAATTTGCGSAISSGGLPSPVKRTPESGEADPGVRLGGLPSPPKTPPKIPEKTPTNKNRGCCTERTPLLRACVSDPPPPPAPAQPPDFSMAGCPADAAAAVARGETAAAPDTTDPDHPPLGSQDPSEGPREGAGAGEPGGGSGGAPQPEATPEAMIAIWNQVVTGTPIRPYRARPDAGLRQALTAMIEAKPFRRFQLEAWETYCRFVAADPAMRGEQNGPGYERWRANLPHVLQPHVHAQLHRAFLKDRDKRQQEREEAAIRASYPPDYDPTQPGSILWQRAQRDPALMAQFREIRKAATFDPAAPSPPKPAIIRLYDYDPDTYGRETAGSPDADASSPDTDTALSGQKTGPGVDGADDQNEFDPPCAC